MEENYSGELLQVLAFVALIATTYGLATIVLLRRYASKARAPLRTWSRVVLALATVGLLCFTYGRFVEPRWVEVTRTRVTTQRLPAGHRGVRIVHLSDLHCDPKPVLEERLPALVAELKPDLIVFTGDCVNSEEAIPVFRRCLAELGQIAPTFAVRGNWDPRARFTSDVLAGLGVVELDGTSASVEVAGTLVHVVGLADESHLSRLNDALGALGSDGPAIVLYHRPYPDVVDTALQSRVDLMCAGHVHGGQVALPLYGAILTLSKHHKRFERGLYPTADGYGFPLYVSRGLGMEGGGAPRVRFCSRPEIALIDLLPPN